MKTKFTIEANVTESDLFEREVSDAVKAYARQVARDAIEGEIRDEIKRVASSRASDLTRTNYGWGSEPKIQKLVRESVDEKVKAAMGNSNTFKVNIYDIVNVELDEAKKRINEDIKSEIQQIISGQDFTEYIKSQIKEQVPNAVLSAIKDSMSSN
jgi:ribosomal protein S8E